MTCETHVEIYRHIHNDLNPRTDYNPFNFAPIDSATVELL